MASIRIPIVMEGASYTAGKFLEQAVNGTNTTEIINIGKKYSMDCEAANSNGIFMIPSSTLTSCVTLEGWFKFESLPTAGNLQFLMGQWHTTNATKDNLALFVYHTGGIPRLHGAFTNTIAVNYTVNGSTTLAVDTWYHCAVVLDVTNDTLTVFLNGVSDGQTTLVSGSQRTTDAWYTVGFQVNFSRFFDGKFTEIRFWDSVRTATQLADNKSVLISPTTANLKAYYRLDEGQSTAAFDSTTNINHGATEEVLTALTGYPLASTDVPFAYDSGNPEITLAELDSGVSGSTWDMSTFDIYENPHYWENGSWKYQYKTSDSSGGGSYNGTWLTKASFQTESDPTGRYMTIKAQAISNGAQPVGLRNGEITASVSVGGGNSFYFVD